MEKELMVLAYLLHRVFLFLRGDGVHLETLISLQLTEVT